MSRRTQVLSIFFAVFCFSIGAAAGDGMDDLNNAMNDFYKASKESPDKSPAGVAKLREQILAPAERKSVEAANKGSTSGGGSGSAAASGGASSSETSHAVVSEPIMDAKDVPAELEFPGAPKTAASPRK